MSDASYLASAITMLLPLCCLIAIVLAGIMFVIRLIRKPRARG